MSATIIAATLTKICAQSSFEQRSVSDTFTDTLRGISRPYSTKYLAEKVYVHFDRDSYRAGDTCWYKAYVVSNADLQLSTRSGVLYVDLISPEGALITHQQLKLKDGVTTGDFVFYHNTPRGIYTVRAYTQWMRNEDSDFFYRRSLTVYAAREVSDNGTIPRQNKVSPIEVQFFPEGGTIVNGIAGKVAFKAIDDNSRGIDIDGQIIDEHNAVVTSFRSTHNGMGLFLFIPQKNKSYKARLGNGELVGLPKTEDSGVALFANALDQHNLRIQVQVSPDLLGSHYYLVSQIRGEINSWKLTMNALQEEIKIPKYRMASGVMQLTLFDQTGIPRCERMVFINNHPQLNIRIQSDKEVYLPRELIKLSVKVTDPDGNPVKTNLSMAVTDEAFATKVPHENILTQLLLQSDMKGVIENPAWYFKSEEPAYRYGLDLVMLTHGFRKFNWSEMLNHKFGPMPFSTQTGLTLQGTIIDQRNKKPLSKGKITMISKGGGYEGQYTGATDEKGGFRIDNIDYNDSTMQVWKTENANGIPVQSSIIFLDDDFPPLGHEINTMSFTPSEKLNKKIAQINSQSLDSARVLEEVEITGKKIKEKSIWSAGANGVIVKPTSTDLQINPFQFIIRFAAGLPNLLKFTNFNRPDGSGESANPAVTVFIDGFQRYGDPFIELNTIPTEDIDFVGIYGDMHSYLIVIKSKKNGSIQKGPGPGITNLTRSGYNMQREFYVPKYLPNDTTRTPPDIRTTLFWKPDVFTDDFGNAQVVFHNSDSAKTLRVIIEGIEDGIAGSFEKTIGPAQLQSYHQNSLHGEVVDEKSGETIPAASVFLAKTMIGTIAKSDGSYALENIPIGKYDLTVSSIGYKIKTIPIELDGQAISLDIKLEHDVNVLDEVVIKGKKSSSNRAKYIRIFQEQFLGKTANARKCRITNIDKIDFEYDRDSLLLIASCAEPIEIENLATGYKLSYLLTQFKVYDQFRSYKVVTTGIPRFEELPTTNIRQSSQWKSERDRAYLGSMNHFMRSLSSRTLDKNNFKVFVEKEVLKSELTKPGYDFGPTDENFLLSARSDTLVTVKVVYTRERSESNYPQQNSAQISYIKFKDRGLVISNNGYFDNFSNFLVEGYFGWAGGIAEMIPIEYHVE